MQIDYGSNTFFGKEDCLYLNVYRPIGPPDSVLPVMVFIHGGSFTVGSTDPAQYGPDYLMDTEEVIVVTVAYRLGIFGFLSSGDRNCQGNFGLKDQNVAMQWIQRNIEEFGGNPSKITLFGQSAGAASVQYQMISPRSNGKAGSRVRHGTRRLNILLRLPRLVLESHTDEWIAFVFLGSQ